MKCSVSSLTSIYFISRTEHVITRVHVAERCRIKKEEKRKRKAFFFDLRIPKLNEI